MQFKVRNNFSPNFHVLANARKAYVRRNKNGLQGSVILLSIFGVDVVLQLGHSVTLSRRLGPGLGGVSSSLLVKFSVVLEDTGLLDISLVVGGLLGILLVANLLVLGSAQSRGNIGVGSDLSGLDLLSIEQGCNENKKDENEA